MLQRLTRISMLAGAAGALVGGLTAVLDLGINGGWPGEAALLCIALAVGGALGWLLMRSNQRSVDDITHAAERAMSGDLTARTGTAPPATASLAHEFNSMIAAIEERRAALLDERERLTSVFRASIDPMVAVDPDTAVKFLNEAAAELFGVSPDYMLGRPLIEGVRDHEIDAAVREAVAGTSSARVVAHGRERRLVRVLAVPVQGAGDWKALLVITDLSEAQRLDRVRRDFLANVSHELQTPLAAIQVMVETLELGNIDDEDEAGQFLGRICRETERMTAMVRELLDLSRIESGALELDIRPVPVDEVFADALGRFAEAIAAKEIAVERVGTVGVDAMADRDALLRILTNLLHNAVRVAPTGSAIRVGANRTDGETAIRVSDEGPGIHPQDLSRVFERFFKGDASRSEAGTGLGLAIVKHLAQAHGGTVEATSEPGKGATFTVRLPWERTARARVP